MNKEDFSLKKQKSFCFWILRVTIFVENRRRVMTMDLWNFNKESLQQSLQKSNEELPDSILREQAEALEKKQMELFMGKPAT